MIERYRREEVQKIFTEESKFQAYLLMEIYTLEAWSTLGVIPKEDVDKVRRNAKFDVERIKAADAPYAIPRYKGMPAIWSPELIPNAIGKAMDMAPTLPMRAVSIFVTIINPIKMAVLPNGVSNSIIHPAARLPAPDFIMAWPIANERTRIPIILKSSSHILDCNQFKSCHHGEYD